MSSHPRTVVEFLDHPGTHLCHKTVTIAINGTPVLVERDGIDVDIDPDGVRATTVTVRLLPTEIHFTRRPEPEDVLGHHNAKE